MQIITEIDLKILDLIQRYFTCGFMDTIMPVITFLGNAGLIWIAAAVICIAAKKYRKTGIGLACGLAGSGLICNLILKNLFARERPFSINETVTLLINAPQDYSFPSGHTTSSFAAAAVIMHNDKRLGTAAYILASLIAFSRLYLYVHYPSDVLAGVLLGTAIGVACSCVIDKKYEKFGDENGE